jgi:hypothetical protein
MAPTPQPRSSSTDRASLDATTPASLTLARDAVVLEVKDAAAGPASQLASQLSTQTIDQQASRVFVAPRVVDERAFEQLASTLRGLTTDAASQARSLVQAGEGVRTLSANLSTLTKDIAQRTEQAGKVLPLLEQRVASAQSLVDRVTRDAAIAKAREARDTIAAHFQQQLTEWQSQFIAQARQTLLAAPLPQDLTALIREHVHSAVQAEVQQQVHRTIEASVRDAVRDALRTLQADVRDTMHQGATKLGLFPTSPGQIVPVQTVPVQATPVQAAPPHAQATTTAIDPAALAATHALHTTLTKADTARAALDAATTKATTTASHLERTVEAVATEISQQLTALRSDTALIIGGCSARIEGLASSAAEHAAKQAMTQAFEQTKTTLVGELQRHIGEVLEPEITKQEAATIEAIQTAQHAAYETISTLTASAHTSTQAAIESLGHVIEQARKQQASMQRAELTHAPASNTPATPLATPFAPTAHTTQHDLHATIEQGQLLLRTLSERIEAASHATDTILSALDEATATASAPTAPLAPAQPTQAQLAQANQAIAHLTHLLTHAAQAGTWLQALLHQSRPNPASLPIGGTGVSPMPSSRSIPNPT